MVSDVLFLVSESAFWGTFPYGISDLPFRFQSSCWRTFLLMSLPPGESLSVGFPSFRHTHTHTRARACVRTNARTSERISILFALFCFGAFPPWARSTLFHARTRAHTRACVREYQFVWSFCFRAYLPTSPALPRRDRPGGPPLPPSAPWAQSTLFTHAHTRMRAHARRAHARICMREYQFVWFFCFRAYLPTSPALPHKDRPGGPPLPPSALPPWGYEKCLFFLFFFVFFI